MDGFGLPLATALLLFPVLFMALPPMLSAWRRRHEVRRRFDPGPRSIERLTIPPADETAWTVLRFREAVRHSELSEYLRPD